MNHRYIFCLLSAALTTWVTMPAAAQDASTPGATSTPHPTFTNLSVEWALSGDADADGVVTVRYREDGAQRWRTGLPLRRVPAGSNEARSWSNKHSGSLFGLKAATTYEIELSLQDADGGSAVELLTATTRSWPTEPATPTLKPVTPATIEGALSSASPGDVFVLADGNYASIAIANDGSEGMPIVLRPENPGGATVQGDVRADGRTDIHILGLLIEGKIKFNNGRRIVVRDCTIDTTTDGIVAFANGVEDALIMDNLIRGATSWKEGALGVSGNNIGEGIALTGPGNVIAFNRVVGFRDCISLLEDSEAVEQYSIDIFGNDLDICADDGIEADFAMGNVRVYNNRITNAFMGISSQPNLGGPSYFIRNVMFNVVLSAFKLQRSSVGDVGLHNTVVKAGDAFGVFTDDVWSRAYFRNNIFIGGNGGSVNGYDIGPGRVLHLPSADGSCSFDYDGYGSIGTNSFSGDVNGVTFDGLDELRAVTTETNAIELGMSVFADTPGFPSNPLTQAAPPNLALAAAAVAVDKGEVLANINDGYAAAAPDLGAYELGQPLPEYGPGGRLGGGSGGSGSGGSSGNGGGGGSTAGSGGGAGASGPSGAGDEEAGCGCRVALGTARRGQQDRGNGAGERSAYGLFLLGLAWLSRRHRR